MARYALVIGISDYKEPFDNLSQAFTDAAAVKERLEGKELEEKYKVTLLIGSVTTIDLAKALKTFLLEQADHSDALIYFTGHGFQKVDLLDIEPPEGFLATSDCVVTLENQQVTNVQGGLSFKALNTLIAKSNLSSLVVLLDACHSGSFIKQTLTSLDSFTNSDRPDHCLITACREFEEALARKRDTHSVFTEALLQGLSVNNADQQGKITSNQLFDFIYRQLENSHQEPYHMGQGRSITLMKYPSNSAASGISALAELLKSPQVREHVDDFYKTFEEAKKQIDLLREYKSLHDQLHTLEFQCQRILANELSQLSENCSFNSDDQKKNQKVLKRYAKTLKEVLQEIQDIAEQSQKATSGVEQLSGTCEELLEVLTYADKTLAIGIEQLLLDQLNDAVVQMKEVLSIFPSKINTLLCKTASDLKLPDLVKAMGFICQSCQLLPKDSVNAQQLEQFQTGVNSLNRMEQLLTQLIENHDALQSLDALLRLVEINPEQTLERTWQVRRLRPKTDAICDSIINMSELYESQDIRELNCDRTQDSALECKQACQVLDETITNKNRQTLCDDFLEYRTFADNLFFLIDKDLKHFCFKLSEIGTPLATVLEVLSK